LSARPVRATAGGWALGPGGGGQTGARAWAAAGQSERPRADRAGGDRRTARPGRRRVPVRRLERLHGGREPAGLDPLRRPAAVAGDADLARGRGGARPAWPRHGDAGDGRHPDPDRSQGDAVPPGRSTAGQPGARPVHLVASAGRADAVRGGRAGRGSCASRPGCPRAGGLAMGWRDQVRVSPRTGWVLAIALCWLSAGPLPYREAFHALPMPNDFTPDYVVAATWLKEGRCGHPWPAVLDRATANDHARRLGAPRILLLGPYYTHPPPALAPIVP